MRLKAYRVEMYRGIIDSGWIPVESLTVLVGKNEAGKTSLLRALHKLNPFKAEAYEMDKEWPRGRRTERSKDQVVCTAQFEFSPEEVDELGQLTHRTLGKNTLAVKRDYGGRLQIELDEKDFPEDYAADDTAATRATLLSFGGTVSDSFRGVVESCVADIPSLAAKGKTAVAEGAKKWLEALRAAQGTAADEPGRTVEESYIGQFPELFTQSVRQMQAGPTIRERAVEYIKRQLPTFIYMSDYRAFTGSALLNQVKERKDRQELTESDKTLLTIMELSGLDLETEVNKAAVTDKDQKQQRQFDLSDASATLTKAIENRWKQRKYQVQFRADGYAFYTFVQDDRDPSLIDLEERSKGFQWFFSFDMMFMYESKGTFKNCVILLDEPGLHLHPDAQRDLLRRMADYAGDNTLVYTTHLPFMIDLRHPERIRVLSETPSGTVVTENLTESQPEAKLVLQSALGISGSSSYLVAQRNLVLEGVDDFWILTELSRLQERSNQKGLPDDVFLTPAGGASEAAYIATFMIGQKLEVVVLLDSDRAGESARDRLVKRWLTRYQGRKAEVVQLGEAVGESDREFSVEDLFGTAYAETVWTLYRQQLEAAGCQRLEVAGSGPILGQIENFFKTLGVPFNKGSVAKVIRRELANMKNIDELPPEMRSRVVNLFTKLNQALERVSSGP
jgi:predicted ATP-dependent endonuclease of OLD family